VGKAAVAAAHKAKIGLPIQCEADRLGRSSRRLRRARTGCRSTTWSRLREAVRIVGPHPLEASGGSISIPSRAIAETGVDFISVGRITQSAPAVDIGLDYSLQELPR
jgi:nicotinate-nucleotide pyrophosphorylase (carboxylating)